MSRSLDDIILPSIVKSIAYVYDKELQRDTAGRAVILG